MKVLVSDLLNVIGNIGLIIFAVVLLLFAIVMYPFALMSKVKFY